MMKLHLEKLKSKLVFKLLGIFTGISCLFLFQNCDNFGSFVAYEELGSMDYHRDAWKKTDGLEVKNGEWVKVEEDIVEKPRLTDRKYIASKLASIAIYGNKNSQANIDIQNKLNAFIGREISNFGGPCQYNNPEKLPISSSEFAICGGIALTEVYVDLIPSPNVYRSAIKQATCDYLASTQTVQNNIIAHIQDLADLLKTNNVPYTVYQLFYTGRQPRKRTLASLEELYSVAVGSNIGKDVLNKNGVKMLTLALCHSNGWELP